jgi:phosphate transport system permease protein
MDGERIAQKVFLLAAVLSASVTVLLLAFMVILGLPLFQGGLFLEILTQPWLPGRQLFGVWPMIAGTLAIASLAVAIAFPLSLGVSSLIAVVAPGRIARLVKSAVAFMTGIPTVVYGFVGVFLLVPLVRESLSRGSGLCVLSAALVLGILVAPTMILFFSDALARVPRSHRIAAEALGATPAQVLIYVLIPGAWRGIVTGLVLSTGRAVGDTLIALMLAGNAAQVPNSLLDSARALTAHIALVIASDFDSLEFKTIFACGILLYAFTAAATLAVRRLGRKRTPAR